MPLFRRFAAAAALTGVLLSYPGVIAPAHAAAKVGVSAAVQGKVFVRSGADAEGRKVKTDESIFLQDEVLTKQESALQILLLDESVFTVGENCELTIDRFVYDPDRGAGEMSGRVLKGAFRFMSGKIGKSNPANANLETPAGVIGIRGTMLEAAVGGDAIGLAELLGLSIGSADPNSALLALLRGPGRRSNGLNKSGIITVGNSAGTKTIAAPNYAVFIPGAGQKPIGPVKVTAEVLKYFDFYLRSLPNGPSYGGDRAGSGEGESGQHVFNIPEDDFPPFNDLFSDGFFDSQTPTDGGGGEGGGGEGGEGGEGGGCEGICVNNF